MLNQVQMTGFFALAMAKRTPRVRDCSGNPFVRVRTKDWNGKPDPEGNAHIKKRLGHGLSFLVLQ